MFELYLINGNICPDSGTDEQKIALFKYLSELAISGEQKYEEMYWDLSPMQRKEYSEWLSKSPVTCS